MNTKRFLLSALALDCGKRRLFLLLTFAVITTFGSAQKIQGTLTSTVASKNYISCANDEGELLETTYSWVFTDPSGGTHPFPGTSGSEIWEAGLGCNFTNEYWSINTWSTDGLYYITGTNGSEAVTGIAGWINPKYIIVDVMYAPPGSKSTVTYGDNSVVGSTTAYSSSFSTGISESISVSAGGGVAGFSAKETTTVSNSYTQEEENSTSIAVSQTTSASTGLTGYSDPVNGLNHDYDYIFVWLNPLQLFSLYTNASGTDTSVTWNGFGYDLNDTPAYPDMDVIGIQLGCLNGDFYQQYEGGTNSNWLTCEDVFTNNFSRSWALTNTDGSSPALTPTLAESSPPYNFCASSHKGTDLYNLCQADPFGANPNYTVTFAAGSSTTTDGRFTACSNAECNATIEYEPDVNKNYSQGYSTTATSNETAKYTYSSSFSMEVQFGWSGGNCTKFCANFGTDTKDTTTYTSIDQFSYSTNDSSGQTASFAVVGPAEGYNGPDQFVVYQDNLYGTFMFYPGN
jgi:hypothetical protein